MLQDKEWKKRLFKEYTKVLNDVGDWILILGAVVWISFVFVGIIVLQPKEQGEGYATVFVSAIIGAIAAVVVMVIAFGIVSFTVYLIVRKRMLKSQ